MNNITQKLLSVELNDVPLPVALYFVNRHCKTDEEKIEVLTCIANRNGRSNTSLAEFERRVFES